MDPSEDDIVQSYFTVGLAEHLEPLPQLLYEIVQDTSEAGDSDDDMSVGQGQRLRPQLRTFAPAPLSSLKSKVSVPVNRECIKIWSKLLVMLDGADADPHFWHLRQFFDARIHAPEQARQDADEEEEADTHPSPLERRSSMRSTGFRAPKIQWSRRPTISTVEEIQPMRSFLGSIRRGSTRRPIQEADVPRTDMYEIWVGTETERKCIHFPVRLDLHSVGLANPRMQSAASEQRATAEKGRTNDTAYQSVAHDMGKSLDESVAGSMTASQTSRRSFMHRMLDRGFRRGSQASGASVPGWIHGMEDVQDIPTNALDDSDDEHGDAVSPLVRNFHHRRASVASSAARSHAVALPKTSELGRVEEGTTFEPSEQVSSVQHRSDPSEAKSIPPIAEGEDFLSLLRKACSYATGPHWLSGDSDPLPAIIMFAMADAFGWEGILHLCYGKDSMCDREQVFASLGRAAYMESHRKQKYEAVLSWRKNIVSNANENFMADNGVLDTMPSEPPVDDVESVSTRRSLLSEQGAEESEKESSHQRARHTFARTWDDWKTLFTSLSAWVSEYETVRVQTGLAHEYGQEPTFTVPSPSHLPRLTLQSPPLCVEQDALQGAYGFWRLSGIPAALRLESHHEHMDYRWSRAKLRSSQLGTPMVLGVAGVQFMFRQLSSSAWVYNSAWELTYLDDCIFQSPIVRTRFPPPGDHALSSADGYDTVANRTVECPYPNTEGTWAALDWKQWLSTLYAGQILVPTVSWQGWWTLVAVLNGADRSGRAFDLQLRAPGEPLSSLDHASVYL
ncbi:hypothetical protein ACI68E_003500 [Malassezia pachydermatis]|uniref:Uncharacterized protein n=1 Tax=Malassezia pachydermatis TaxID=77020 RepID=A0A0M9VNP2_9BASI|nr:hypothetical protein Malapachy_0025 [Malassezia pachydermatis]KOS13525.1 hypothetical protein Malapachy_0025 [Malassezia pachydermatis]